MDVKEIVEKYLKEYGYDGLYSPHIECGCKVGDLMPCGFDVIESCKPGYLVPCEYDEEKWCIREKNERKKQA